LIIHKTCEVYSLWFFEKLLELIGISRGVHLDLSNGNSTTVCGVFLIPRFLFVINNGSRSSIRICPQNDLGFPFVVGSRYSWRGSHHITSSGRALFFFLFKGNTDAVETQQQYWNIDPRKLKFRFDSKP
jgi:hypothetical protein